MIACPTCAQRVPDGRLVCQRGHSLREAQAEGAEHTKFDDMDQAALRKLIGKLKAMGDQAPAQTLIRANQALARKLALAEAAFDPFKHPRTRGGKFARVSRVVEPERDRDRLQREWAELDRKLLPFAGNPNHPEARQIIERQKEIVSQLHMPGMGSPGSTGESDVRDVAIVGSGPAGLSAAIYGGTEGLDTVLLEGSKRVGGQAGMSSRIENNLGFPAGVTGSQLAEQGLEQAQRVGAETRFGKRVVGMDYDPDSKIKTLHMDDGSSVRARAVVVAGGVQFRKVEFPGSDSPDVIYGDSKALKEHARGKQIVIVGGANSAGQAAIDAASEAEHVTILLRHGKLSDKMSSYLVGQLESDPKVTVLNGEIEKADTDAKGRVDGVTLKDGRKLPAGAVGVFIGSSPSAHWTGADMDEKGYLKVGQGSAAPLETSIPGVFAAGDVRSGSVHRVVTAAADGAAAVSYAHPFLRALGQPVQEARQPKQPKPKPEPAPAPAPDWDDWMERISELDREQPFTGADEPPDGDSDATSGNVVQETARYRWAEQNGKRVITRVITNGHEREVLGESWEEWDAARKAGKFSHAVKSGPMPGHTIDSPGRGPTGKLRNFHAMSDEKLAETLEALELHGEDPEAHKAAMAAAAEKLGVFDGGKIKVPAAKVPGKAPDQILLNV